MTDARALTQTLGGRWYGAYGAAPCPNCQPARRRGQNALTLSDGSGGRLLAHCKRAGCAFLDILAAARVGPGDYRPPDPLAIAARDAKAKAERERRARHAYLAWSEAVSVAGTPAERYLRDARAITCPLPETLRFHPDAWHGPTAKRYPALVALIEGADGFAVHRTYLCPDGSAKAAVDPNKAMLGAASGGAVRLTDAPGTLAVAEGIETALSLACGLLRGPATIWAALSTSGIRGLRLPPDPAKLVIASDGDPAGIAAANALAARASGLGWSVSLLPAPEGWDWNDVLRIGGQS